MKFKQGLLYVLSVIGVFIFIYLLENLFIGYLLDYFFDNTYINTFVMCFLNVFINPIICYCIVEDVKSINTPWHIKNEFDEVD